MGLDMYVGTHSGEEIAYWRKHNRLHKWMENLWQERKEAEKLAEKNRDIGDRFIDAIDKVEDEYDDVFNCIEVQLFEEDIDRLERDIKNNALPPTTGFFFGTDSYEDYEEGYKAVDEKFIKDARQALKDGEELFYDSSW